ncbi:HflK protein [Candidatus Endobugula sertula]|uniref:Protein HflK n=1 Tax=Candidatus Endobugula sertula TaxID=62101 RepID=A0A1D2QMN8_9GAMM|nr:HflK protein [Candidatus Endobugula sertula]
MAWNEPGGSNQDPWGGNRNNGGPPDLDEVLKNVQKKIDGFFGGKGGKGGDSGFSFSFLVVAFVVLLIGYLVSGIYQLDEKERALILRLGKFHSVEGPGLHWNPPLIDKRFSANVTEERQYRTGGLMLTEDESIVEVPVTVQYNIADIKAFTLNVRDPKVSLQHAADSALRHVVGSTELNQALSEGRGKIAAEMQKRLQTYLDSYGTGIYIVGVNIQEGRPPSAVKEAFDDVVNAKEDRERLKNEAQAYANGIVPEARGKAQRTIEEANAYRDQVIARAEGESARFNQLLTEYIKAPEVTRERLYLDAIESVMKNSSKVLIDVEGGNNMMYLPLDKITEQSSVSRRSLNDGISESELQDISNRVVERLRREQSNRSSRGTR